MCVAFDGTLKFDTSIEQKGFKLGLEGLGSIAKTGMAAVAGAITAATGAMAALGAKAVAAYADYEQLTGGVATLFGAQEMSLDEYAKSVGKSVDAVRKDYDNLIAAQNDVMQNAAQAFRTAGLSQNQYMKTVTSFSAALIASLGGDTKKAAEVADLAIVDMADNANKMGSSMESIQNAYQGFAKQNYTMLDNLKLGYGGTKTEMQRLLADAEKISGQKFDLSSYADIVEAIHVIQTEMGITGTTAKEAAETISGSVSSMKAAWDNLLVGIADDEQDFDKLVDDLVSSAATAASNILPRIETIIGGTGKLISSMSGVAADLVVQAASYIPDLVAAGTDMISAIAEGLASHASDIARAGKQVLKTLINGVISVSEQLGSLAKSLLTSFVKYISANRYMVASTATQLVTTLISGIGSAASDLISLGTTLIVSLVHGIVSCLPEICESAKSVIENLVQTIVISLPQIITAGIDIIIALADAISENIDLIITAALTVIQVLCESLLNGENLQKLLDAGITLLMSLTQAIVDNLPLLIDIAIQILTFLCTELLAPDNIMKLLDAAFQIVTALVDAIIDNVDELLLAVEQIITSLCDYLCEPGNLEKLLKTGAQLLGKIIAGLCQIGGKLLGFGAMLFDDIDQATADIDWGSIGRAIVEGICSGLLDCDFVLDDFLGDFKENWVSGFKDIFGIHSPSKLMHDEVGEYLALGIGDGFADSAAKIGKQIVQNVSSWGATLADAGKKIGDGFVSATDKALSLLPGDTGKLLKETAGGIAEWGKGVIASGKDAASDFVDGIIGFAKRLPELAQQPLSETLSQVIGWGTSLIQRGRDAAQSVVSTIADAFSSLPSLMSDVGHNLVEGLWNGMSTMGGWIKDKISGFGSTVVSGFKSIFKIHSPSAVMRDLIGKQLAAGIGVGFTDEIPQVGKDALDAFRRLKPTVTDGALDAFRAGSAGGTGGIVQPSPTSGVVNNYTYNTTNNTPSGSPAQPAPVNVYARIEMDGDVIAEKLVDRVDTAQGESATLDERGTAH